MAVGKQCSDARGARGAAKARLHKGEARRSAVDVEVVAVG